MGNELTKHTLFETLDSNWGGVVPETFPHLAKLSVAKLSHKFETGSVNFPLVSGAMREAFSNGLFDL